MSIEDSMAKADKMTVRTRLQRLGLLLAKYQRKALVVGGILLIAISFWWGFSSPAMGASSYVLGVWALSTGVFLGFRDWYNIVLLGVGIALGLGDYYRAPPLVCPSGIGITLGAFNALLHSINTAGKAKKIRLSPPKPPWMAITLVAILALGMLSPLGSTHLTTAASAKFEITILDDGRIQYQLGDNRSRYDVLIQDNKSVVEYSLTVLNDTGQIEVNENGREYSFQLDLPNPPKAERALASASEPRALEPYFWWDRIWFINETKRTVKYPHPDREKYDISLWSSWWMYGTKLLHYQFDQTTSIDLAQYGPTAITSLIGAIVGELIAGPAGAVVGLIAGIVVGIIATGYTQGTWLDESSCLWWWTAKNWLHWLSDYALELAALWVTYSPGAIYLALSSFYCMGYLRIGTLTYADFVAVGSPGDPETPVTPVVMWEEAYYFTKPGGRVCYYDANIGEYIIEYPLAPYDIIPR